MRTIWHFWWRRSAPSKKKKKKKKRCKSQRCHNYHKGLYEQKLANEKQLSWSTAKHQNDLWVHTFMSCHWQWVYTYCSGTAQHRSHNGITNTYMDISSATGLSDYPLCFPLFAPPVDITFVFESNIYLSFSFRTWKVRKDNYTWFHIPSQKHSTPTCSDFRSFYYCTNKSNILLLLFKF